MRLLILVTLGLIICFIATSCTQVGVTRTSGGGIVAGVTSFFGEVMAKDVNIVTREGDQINIGAVASHNPDRTVTKTVGDVAKVRAVVPVVMEGVKGFNATELKGTKDPNIIPKDPNIIPVDPQFVPPTE